MDYDISTILADITPEELPFPYSKIAREINVETAIKLAEIVQGCSYSFPKLDEIIRKKRNEQIIKEFDGYNIKELALKYNLTDRWIRELVGVAEDEDQIDINSYL